jgi:hypothetical protein
MEAEEHRRIRPRGEHPRDLPLGRRHIHRAVLAPAMVEEEIDLKQPHTVPRELPEIMLRQFFP